MIDGIERIDLVKIVEQAGITLRGPAQERIGPCPKCGGHDRFHVKIHDGRGWCFCRQCHEQRMDAVDFTSWMRGCSTAEAIQSLGLSSTKSKSIASIWSPAAQPVRTQTPQLQTPPSDSWQTLARSFVDSCEKNLWAYDERSERAIFWLNNRGIIGDEIRHARLGFNLARGFIDAERTVWAERGFVIPHYYDGHLWRVRIRRFPKDIDAERAANPDSRPDKYKVLSGAGEDKTILYGDADLLLSEYGEQRIRYTTVVVVAGEYDALLLRGVIRDHVDDVAVVTPGSESTSVKPEWIRLLLGRRVLVCMDADDAGRQAAQKWITAIPSARIITPPRSAKDITDAWKSVDIPDDPFNDPDTHIREWLRSAIDESRQTTRGSK